MIGKLEVVVGPMFAGKTTELLKRILWSKNGLNVPVLVIKPKFDTRYAETRIVSHDGLTVDAISISNVLEIPQISENTAIFIDECQFFMEPYFDGDIVQWVYEKMLDGHAVMATGLDTDWESKPFIITSKLLGMATDISKLTANCTVCGRDAKRTYKKTKSGGSVELGLDDVYESRCLEHWDCN